MARIVRSIAPVAAFALLALAGALPTRAQSVQPPQAWLFGTWTGGLFPPPTSIGAQECLAQPVMIFTRDIVMRALITDQLYTQRLVETARSTASGVEFHFARSAPPQAGPFSLSQGSAEVGFGCDSPDVLHVRRMGENEISFPGCADFPYPLVRCPAR